MRVSSLSFRNCLLRAFLVAAGLGLTLCPAQEQGKKVEFSSQESAVASTNAAKSGLEQSEFQQFKEDLFRPFGSLDQKNSMNGVMSLRPPQQPRPSAVPDKHTRELIDRRKNWAFTDMNDLYPQPGMEDAFGVRQYAPDGKEKTDRSAIEKFYERLNQDQSTNAKQLREGLEEMEIQNFSSTNAVNPWDFTFPGSTASLKSAGAKGDADKASRNLTPFVNPLLNSAVISDALENQKKRLSEFQELLEPRAPARQTNSAANSFVQDLFRTPAQADRNDSFGHAQTETIQPRRAALNPLLGVINQTTPASLDSRIFHDPTAEALGLPSLMSAKPPVAPKAPQLTGVLPKRKF